MPRINTFYYPQRKYPARLAVFTWRNSWYIRKCSLSAPIFFVFLLFLSLSLFRQWEISLSIICTRSHIQSTCFFFLTLSHIAFIRTTPARIDRKISRWTRASCKIRQNSVYAVADEKFTPFTRREPRLPRKCVGYWPTAGCRVQAQSGDSRGKEEGTARLCACVSKGDWQGAVVWAEGCQRIERNGGEQRR